MKADPLGIDSAFPGAQPGVLHGLLGRCQAIMHETVVAARLLGRDVIGDLEVPDLAGDPRGQLRDIERRDGPDTAAAAANRLPTGGDSVADRRDEAQARYDYAA